MFDDGDMFSGIMRNADWDDYENDEPIDYVSRLSDEIVDLKYRLGMYEKLRAEYKCETIKDFASYIEEVKENECDFASSIVSLEVENKNLQKELEVYKKALELACEDLNLYEDVTSTNIKIKCYIEDAREELEKEDDK